MKTYGKLAFDRGGKRWAIGDMTPHVAIALKRLFPRVPETATIALLSDADDVRADISWFMLRYPLACSESDREELEAGSRRIAQRMAERERILLPTWEPAGALGFRNGEKPYKYQAQAAAVAIENPGLLLGDDAGLGKTISAAATCTMGAPMPAAIVVEAHLGHQWAEKLRHFTELRVHVILGRTPYSLPPADVYLFRYSNVAGWSDIFAKGVFRTVIYDEIQMLRHGALTAKGKACTILSDRADLRMGLTATPIYNYGDEIHRIMDFIQRGLLGTREEFLREWGRIVKDPDALGAYLRETGFLLRRTEDDESVDLSLPPANILDWEVEFDHRAAADELELARTLALTVMRSSSFVESGRAARELDLKMRQITGIAKAKAVAVYVKMLLRDTPRVLLAGWHREVYSIWRAALADYDPVLYTGSETAAGKKRSFDAFTRGSSRVMFISLRSGAGIDGLQQYCRDLVIGELDWSPQVHYQLIRRLRRPGMPRWVVPGVPWEVTAHYVHTNGGSDPVLLETLGVKADQSRGINDPGIAPKAKYSDASRIKMLAQYVLSGEVVPAAAPAVRKRRYPGYLMGGSASS